MSTRIPPKAAPAPSRQTQRRGRVPVSPADRQENTIMPREQEWLTVNEVCAELKISRRTFERWRARGTAPQYKRLGQGGPIRIKRVWLDDWMESEEGAA